MTDHWINRRSLFTAAGVLGVTAVAPAAAAAARRREAARGRAAPRPPPDTHPDTDPDSRGHAHSAPVGTGSALIGMSAPASVWDAKVAAVGAGLARAGSSPTWPPVPPASSSWWSRRTPPACCR